MALGNNTNYGLASSVWTENVSLALEVAISLKAGTVWVNCHNLFDAAAGFGGYRHSGYGRDGGKEVCYEGVFHLNHAKRNCTLRRKTFSLRSRIFSVIINKE